MLAKRFAGILPPLTPAEALETTWIHFGGRAAGARHPRSQKHLLLPSELQLSGELYLWEGC
jgi:predicted ATPase with chaperone activity